MVIVYIIILIGFARILSGKGYTIFPTCRTSNKELDSVNLNGGKVITGIDMLDEKFPLKLKEAVGSTPIHFLINNSGILEVDSLNEDIDYDIMRKQYEVNTLGPLKVSKVLLDNFLEGRSFYIHYIYVYKHTYICTSI